MAAKKRRKKAGKRTGKKTATKKRSGKKRARKKPARKKTKKNPKRTLRISGFPSLRTTPALRKKAQATAQRAADIVFEAMKKKSPRTKVKKRDIAKIVTAQLLLPKG